MKNFIGYKKSILFGIGFLFFMVDLKAQEPASARQLFQQGQLEKAKESVDSFVLHYSNNEEGWLLKASIYNAITKDQNFKDLVADGRMDAYQALQKAVALNKTYVEAELKPAGYSLAFDLYNGYTDEGVTYFNAGAERNDKGSYAEALSKFKKAGTIGQFIYHNNWGLTATDTSNVYYSARAAINAGKDEDAFVFAKRITDGGITKTATQKGFEPVYQWLAFYYKQQQDEANLVKYTQLGMKNFPASTYFNLILIDWLRQQKDYTGLFANYQEVFKKQPNNSSYQLAYCNDIFNYLYANKPAPPNRALYQGKLSAGLLQYIKTNPATVDGRLLLGKFYINQANDAAKINKAKEKSLLQQSNKYLTEIINKFPGTDKLVYKEALQLAVANYRRLNMMKEAKRYEGLLWGAFFTK